MSVIDAFGRDHAEAHAASIADPAAFWSFVTGYFGVQWHEPPTQVWDGQMPGRWFEGGTLNYAEHLTWHRQAAKLAAGWRAHGIGSGDVVAAVLPNGPAALAATVAAAMIGAAFTAVALDFGADAALDRLQMVEPAVLLTTDACQHRDRTVDRRDVNAHLLANLPSVRGGWPPPSPSQSEHRYTPVPFDHPLWIMFSSGTTGAPKPIVLSHGGALLQHDLVHALYTDLSPGDRLCWLTSVSWIMWPWQTSAMLRGAQVVHFAGDPTWPSAGAAWQQLADQAVTHAGVSPAFVSRLRAEGTPPFNPFLRRILVSGAHLPEADQAWLEEVTGVPVSQLSGGTDLAGDVLGDVPGVDRKAGWMGGAYLGADVRAVRPDGSECKPGERGEMVIATAMPNMPVRFMGDPDGTRYRETYFERFPGRWSHGDWITFDGQGRAQITGRSDATLNRRGLRLGTAELYAVVDAVPGVTGSLAVHLDGESTDCIILYVSGAVQRDAINAAIRSRLSPMFTPDVIRPVSHIPSANGKKPELAVKRMLQGGPAPLELMEFVL